MSSPETHEQDTPKRWQDLLTAEARRRLSGAYQELFPDLIGDGYEVVDEVGTAGGELLRKGNLVHEVQSKTAYGIIEHLKHVDVMEELHELGLPLRDYKMTFDWRAQAMVPPEFWQTKSYLTISDIKLDRLGITIFAKKILRQS